jgi:hypothetical protein
MVSLNDFLNFKNSEHQKRMLEVQEKEKQLQDIPYIDNIPL